NPGNVKQLQLELQGSGNVYIDDIKLVFYEEPAPVDPWMEEETLPDPLRTPLTIFDDEFIHNNGWGFISDACQEFALTKTDAYSGDKSIHAKWSDADDCKLTKFGASWNKWHPIDMTEKRQTRAFQFRLKMDGGTPDLIEVAMEDYDRAWTSVKIKSEYVSGNPFGDDWTTVTVPLSDFPADANFSKIKMMAFQFTGTGEAVIDEIKLVALSIGE
ncbi:MAG TPA: hypothetical protein VJ911_03755, partial [Cryomorphaceae bacterium]|nr:hypothetical protein [Cryomorphaceae bacterium]